MPIIHQQKMFCFLFCFDSQRAMKSPKPIFAWKMSILLKRPVHFLFLLLAFLDCYQSFIHLPIPSGLKKTTTNPSDDNASILSLSTSSTNYEEVTHLSRRDYKEPANWVTNAKLKFHFDDDETKEKIRITSFLTIVPNINENKVENGNLILNGDSKTLSLVSLSIQDKAGEKITELVSGTDYNFNIDNDTLIIESKSLVKPTCILKVVVDVLTNLPEKSKELSGLYKRDDMYFTHCEPSAFRKITYFPDRPDNCATFEVRIEAPIETYPILLSNGNLREEGILEDNSSRHYAIYDDPHPKPSYLFGLVVAKNLGSFKDTYTTKSGREIQLVIYGEPDQISKLSFAMDTLKTAMKWDEETYGLEYDLDSYNIVAAQHFNIGAMENKGLNIFMTSLIATDPTFTTDVTYDLVEKTIAHEYFHNWSGNRVTIRDWFEFTLKEGLTVYRDQEFTSDIGLRIASRIEAVKILREKQFAEDASPRQRQPIRPEAYKSKEHNLDFLATSTTYHKGAEVFRMLKTILSQEGFRKGLRLYMKRNDGKGATLDDFLSSMADANPNIDLAQFGLWFSTAGTPIVSYDYAYNDSKFMLTLTQQISGEENEESPLLHIPVSVGLLDKVTGEEVVPTTVLNLQEKSQTFIFDGLQGEVFPSLLRDFSAPVYLLPSSNHKEDTSKEQILAFLATYDTDDFNKWESLQELYACYVFSLMNNGKDHVNTIGLETHVMAAFGSTLNDSTIDPSSKAYLLSLPTEPVLFRKLDKIEDPIGLAKARMTAMQCLARKFSQDLKREYEIFSSIIENDNAISPQTDAVSRANRSLRNRLLEYLCSIKDTSQEQETAANLAMKHFDSATCFTDQFIAFRQLASMSGAANDARNEITLKFYQLAKSTNNPAIMNKWFQTQALSTLSDTLQRVQVLTQNPDFKANNAGLFRSLITSFTMNTAAFHTPDGYKFIGNIVRQMDQRAPTLAVELTNKFVNWKRYDDKLAGLMKAELYKILQMRPISKSLLATVTRALPEEDYKKEANGDGASSSGSSNGGVNRKKKEKPKKKKGMSVKAKKGFSQ